MVVWCCCVSVDAEAEEEEQVSLQLLFLIPSCHSHDIHDVGVAIYDKELVNNPRTRECTINLNPQLFHTYSPL